MTMEEKRTLHGRATAARWRPSATTRGWQAETPALDELRKVRLRVLDNGWKRVCLIIKEY